jgi:hypothetical protein
MWLCVSAGWQQRAQAAEGTLPHRDLWSTALQGESWGTLLQFLRCRDLHLPEYLAQCAPALIWPELPGCRERKRGGQGGSTRLSLPQLKNACNELLRRSLNQVLPDQPGCVLLYPCPLRTEVDRFWILIRSY